MRNHSTVRAAMRRVVVGALVGLGLVKLLAYERANRAPAPSTLPDAPPPGPPGVHPDGTVDPDAGVGVFGVAGEPLTDAHGKPVLLRLSDLNPPPPTLPPWDSQPSTDRPVPSAARSGAGSTGSSRWPRRPRMGCGDTGSGTTARCTASTTRPSQASRHFRNGALFSLTRGVCGCAYDLAL
jgi:hypothetical protein